MDWHEIETTDEDEWPEPVTVGGGVEEQYILLYVPYGDPPYQLGWHDSESGDCCDARWGTVAHGAIHWMELEHPVPSQ